MLASREAQDSRGALCAVMNFFPLFQVFVSTLVLESLYRKMISVPFSTFYFWLLTHS